MVTVSNVANASRGELLCITYELLLENIQKAIACEDREERKQWTDKAVEVIKTLAGDLDFDYEIAHYLFHIYVYVQGLLIKGRKKEEFEEAYKLVEKIYSAYKQVASQQEGARPVMQNAEAVYAGLTYGKTELNETTIGQENRGFKA